MRDYSFRRRRRPCAAERLFWLAVVALTAAWAGLWIAFGIVVIVPWGV